MQSHATLKKEVINFSKDEVLLPLTGLSMSIADGSVLELIITLSDVTNFGENLMHGLKEEDEDLKQYSLIDFTQIKVIAQVLTGSLSVKDAVDGLRRGKFGPVDVDAEFYKQPCIAFLFGLNGRSSISFHYVKGSLYEKLHAIANGEQKKLAHNQFFQAQKSTNDLTVIIDAIPEGKVLLKDHTEVEGAEVKRIMKKLQLLSKDLLALLDFVQACRDPERTLDFFSKPKELKLIESNEIPDLTRRVVNLAVQGSGLNIKLELPLKTEIHSVYKI